MTTTGHWGISPSLGLAAGFGSVVEHLPNLQETEGSIPPHLRMRRVSVLIGRLERRRGTVEETHWLHMIREKKEKGKRHLVTLTNTLPFFLCLVYLLHDFRVVVIA